MTESCRACEQQTEPFAESAVLGGIPARFNRCGACGMVQALDPVWLPQAYETAIASLDVGLLDRCLLLSQVTAAVLRAERLRNGRFLDWAGGYGTLTRLMRDRGYDFAHVDPYAKNIFAEGHESADLSTSSFDLVTMFEVLEHLEQPVTALSDVASSTDRLLATTQVLPNPTPRPDEWWYYTLETGQHITLFAEASLRALARRLEFDGVVVGRFVHLFYRGRVSPLTRLLVRRAGLAYGVGIVASALDRSKSLLGTDLEAARNQARS